MSLTTGSRTIKINFIDSFMDRIRSGAVSVIKYAGVFSIVTWSWEEYGIWLRYHSIPREYLESSSKKCTSSFTLTTLELIPINSRRARVPHFLPPMMMHPGRRCCRRGDEGLSMTFLSSLPVDRSSSASLMLSNVSCSCLMRQRRQKEVRKRKTKNAKLVVLRWFFWLEFHLILILPWSVLSTGAEAEKKSIKTIWQLKAVQIQKRNHRNPSWMLSRSPTQAIFCQWPLVELKPGIHVKRNEHSYWVDVFVHVLRISHLSFYWSIAKDQPMDFSNHTSLMDNMLSILFPGRDWKSWRSQWTSDWFSVSPQTEEFFAGGDCLLSAHSLVSSDLELESQLLELYAFEEGAVSSLHSFKQFSLFRWTMKQRINVMKTKNLSVTKKETIKCFSKKNSRQEHFCFTKHSDFKWIFHDSVEQLVRDTNKHSRSKGEDNMFKQHASGPPGKSYRFSSTVLSWRQTLTSSVSLVSVVFVSLATLEEFFASSSKLIPASRNNENTLSISICQAEKRMCSSDYPFIRHFQWIILS